MYMCSFNENTNSNRERTNSELLNEMEYLMEKKPHPHMYSVCGVRTITPRKRRVPPIANQSGGNYYKY
jgi:hypothetical protein